MPKVINSVPAIVSFFHYKTYRIYVSVYRVCTVLNFKKLKNIKVQKFENLFKFAYTGRYLIENIDTVWYLTVQTGTGLIFDRYNLRY